MLQDHEAVVHQAGIVKSAFIAPNAEESWHERCEFEWEVQLAARSTHNRAVAVEWQVLHADGSAPCFLHGVLLLWSCSAATLPGSSSDADGYHA